jgi:ATP-dependent Lhr-like helicase
VVRRDDGPLVLLLAGRAWRVISLDWKRRAYVEPAEDEGRSRWRGQGQFLSHELCRASRRLLAGEAVSPAWSRRVAARMEAIRSDFARPAGDDANVLNSVDGEVAWWTFVVGRANATLAHELGRRLVVKVSSDNFVIRFPPGQPVGPVEQEIRRLAAVDPRSLRPAVNDSARDELKFGECLPVELENRVIEERPSDPGAVAGTLANRTRIIIADRA